MAINCHRNKPFGPGGGTRRLHQKHAKQLRVMNAKMDKVKANDKYELSFSETLPKLYGTTHNHYKQASLFLMGAK